MHPSRCILGLWRLADWRLAPAELASLLRGCLDSGIDTFDLADIYGDYQCESLVGAALRHDPSLKSRIRLISKCGIALLSPARPAHRVKHYDTSAAHIRASVDQSLKALGVERLDLLLLHRPDPLLDADEVAATFHQLQQAGKVQQFGVSNFLPGQLALLQSRLTQPLAANQLEISLRQSGALFDGSLDQCQQLCITPQAWSPLAGGRLLENADSPLRDCLHQLGARFDASPEQLAIAWLLRHPAGIRPVLGSGKLDRLRHLIAAEQLPLDRQSWFELLQAARGHAVA